MPSKVKKSNEEIRRRRSTTNATEKDDQNAWANNEKIKIKMRYHTLWFASSPIDLLVQHQQKRRTPAISSDLAPDTFCIWLSWLNANERSVIVFIAFNWAFQWLVNSENRNHFMIIIYFILFYSIWFHLYLFVWLVSCLFISISFLLACAPVFGSDPNTKFHNLQF